MAPILSRPQCVNHVHCMVYTPETLASWTFELLEVLYWNINVTYGTCKGPRGNVFCNRVMHILSLCYRSFINPWRGYIRVVIMATVVPAITVLTRRRFVYNLRRCFSYYSSVDVHRMPPFKVTHNTSRNLAHIARNKRLLVGCKKSPMCKLFLCKYAHETVQ